MQIDSTQLQEKLRVAEEAARSWRDSSFAERAALLRRVGELCRERAPQLGRIASEEMGKPITQAIAEVEKCALACEYYAERGENFLAPKVVASDASESYVTYEPLGVILAVMPWNFPFWQVMRFAAPVIIAGNVGVLKHASNVPRCAEAFEQLFTDAGAPKGVFQNLAIGSSMVAEVIKHKSVQGVALTGSEYAGSKVAELAGSLIKRSVLELGGSDPFIVLADADIEYTAVMAAKARLQNNGQSCIAAKRFIVVEEVYDAFLEAFKKEFTSAVIGDPLDPTTTIGPIVDEKALQELLTQIEKSVAAGAHIEIGGAKIDMPGNYLAPTILTNVAPGQPAYEEELFGPVASVIRAKSTEDAIRIANDNRFGLGASIWTTDLELAKRLAPRIHSGSVFVNGIVKSDPRLPFGGTGVSGYGRELSEEGLKEFVNVKTVWIK
jgi:succinate-semialdehyde dehydrogenase/glutarate-semialdehyde dehydrogenase